MPHHGPDPRPVPQITWPRLLRLRLLGRFRAIILVGHSHPLARADELAPRRARHLPSIEHIGPLLEPLAKTSPPRADEYVLATQLVCNLAQFFEAFFATVETWLRRWINILYLRCPQSGSLEFGIVLPDRNKIVPVPRTCRTVQKLSNQLRDFALLILTTSHRTPIHPYWQALSATAGRGCRHVGRRRVAVAATARPPPGGGDLWIEFRSITYARGRESDRAHCLAVELAGFRAGPSRRPRNAMLSRMPARLRDPHRAFTTCSPPAPARRVSSIAEPPASARDLSCHDDEEHSLPKSCTAAQRGCSTSTMPPAGA